MLERQLAARGIDDVRVLAAMDRVPRDRFVPVERQAEAYSDNALPIDCGQTISQPFIVALMTQSLELDGRQRVLEIGTGSGYQTAVLAELAREVLSLERHPPLSFAAAQVLDELGYGNVTLLVGDGTLGFSPGAPYDRVIVTAAAERVPPALFDQLAEGGLLVIPLGDAEEQALVAIRKVQGRPETRSLSPCRFVPLVGAAGWPEESG